MAPARITWRPSSRDRRDPGARTVVLDARGWPGHRAGQHVDVRLAAEDEARPLMLLNPENAVQASTRQREVPDEGDCGD